MNKGRISRLGCDETDLTENDKNDGCQSNKRDIAELETESGVINAAISQAWTKKEIESARDKMVFVRSMVKNRKITDEEIRKMTLIAKGYAVNDFLEDCVGWVYKETCIAALERTIAEKIDKAVSLDRPKLLARQKEIEKQIAIHRADLLALRCDDANKNNVEEYLKKLAGGWTEQPTPWGTPGGACQIKYANGKITLVNENKKESGASVSVNSDGTGVITASDWPVSGKIDLAQHSIKWSNRSEWKR
jgi:hypothetical protein